MRGQPALKPGGSLLLRPWDKTGTHTRCERIQPVLVGMDAGGHHSHLTFSPGSAGSFRRGGSWFEEGGCIRDETRAWLYSGTFTSSGFLPLASTVCVGVTLRLFSFEGAKGGQRRTECWA